ncbi:MAG: hypothetical protein HYY33_07190 [Chloroflexi bacterium]|nr:hypothetical protein [Chloroflexota bacterium]MBI2976720.1 hypothetical protein [Chloroflexota bacterium]MBI4314699.1 hypothetical protein [Chloroflexota bacterium]
MPTADLAAIEKLEREIASREDLIQFQQRVIALTRNNRFLGIAALGMGVVVLGLYPIAWLLGLAMALLGGWTLTTAIGKHRAARAAIAAGEAELAACRARLAELRAAPAPAK